MLAYKKYGFLLLFLTFSGLGKAQESQPPRVLFVGNSYTYFWNLPQTVAVMAESRGIKMITAQSTSGGVNLGQHWRSEKELKTRELIEQGSFNMIVLQDHSKRALEAPDSLQYYGSLFGSTAGELLAMPYLYLTWARDWDPYMQSEITGQYKKLAETISARIVPVGPAWERSRQLRPDLNLYDEDGSHPNPTGTYLSACVFFGVFTNQTPIGLPHRLITTDKDGEKLYLNIQSEENALFLQKVAAEVIETYSK